MNRVDQIKTGVQLNTNILTTSNQDRPNIENTKEVEELKRLLTIDQSTQKGFLSSSLLDARDADEKSKEEFHLSAVKFAYVTFKFDYTLL